MATLFDLAARLQAAGAAEGMLLIVVKATLILAIARLLLTAIPRAAGATKHVVATAALVAVGLMPVFTLIMPAWRVGTSVARPAATATSEAAIGTQTRNIGTAPVVTAP